MRRMTFTLYRSPINAQWYFHLKSGNGEIIFQSEGYSAAQSAEKTIKAIRLGAPFAKLVKKTPQPLIL